MKYIKEYVTYQKGEKFASNTYWYLKMIEDAAKFYYDDDVTFLGRGAYGEVFIFNNHPSKVIKITTEENEIGIIERMRKLPVLKHVMNYYDVRQIESKKLSKQFWVILMDRIIPLKKYKNGIYKELFTDYDLFVVNQISYSSVKYSELKYYFQNDLSFDNFWKLNFLVNYPPAYVKKLTKEEIKDFILQFQETLLEMSKYKLMHLSDLHAGNCGFKLNGDFCMYDMMDYLDSRTKLKPIETR